MKNAKVVKDVIQVKRSQMDGQGNNWATVDCSDGDAYTSLPAAIEMDTVTMGKTGWHSDRHEAYYSDQAWVMSGIAKVIK